MSPDIKKRRVLIVSSEFPPQPGGIGTHAWNLAKELSRRDAKINVFTEGRLGGESSEAAFDADCSFPVTRLSFGKFGARQLRRLSEFRSLLQQWDPDVIIASGRFPLLMVGMVPSRVPRIAVIHGSEAGADKSLNRVLVSRVLRSYDFRIVVSRYTADFIQLNEECPFKIIANGVNVNDFCDGDHGSSEHDLEGTPALITVGNVTHRKGQDNVIRALPSLVKEYPDLRYHIVGIPTEQAEFSSLAASLGVSNHVVFHGVVEQERLVPMLGSADLFLMLSKGTKSGDVEGFGIAILEANLLGVPAVGARGCGIEDAIEDQKSGFLVDPSNGADVAEAVRKSLKDRDRLGCYARSRALDYDWKNVGEKYAEIIGDVICRARRQ